MVELVEGDPGPRGSRGWRGGLLVAALAFTGIANACGGRSVWLEDMDDGQAGEGGSLGGVGGYGGDYGGSYGGDYGGTYGGSYGGAYGGSYGGSYGGAYGGSFAGSYGGSFGATGGTVVTGGVGGSYGGVAGSVPVGGTAGKAGCGPTGGTGGGGSPGLYKACISFCTRFPYQSCSIDPEGPADCIAQCQNRFDLGSWCDYALVDFLWCESSYLDPNAMCVDRDGVCYGPGCFGDSILACAEPYSELLRCIENPRPVSPCPPPPNPPLPPNCSQGVGVGDGVCERITECPTANFYTDCYYAFDESRSWYCTCYLNGEHRQTVNVSFEVADACQVGAALCGFP